MKRFFVETFLWLCLVIVLSLIVTKVKSAEDWSLGQASWTATNDGIVPLPQCPPGTVLWQVVVSSSIPGATLGLYDSSGTYTNLLSSISLGGNSGSGAYTVPFEVRVTSGLSYKTTGNGNTGVTIVYKRPFLP